MVLCLVVLWNKNERKSLCFCVFSSCVWCSIQTQNQFLTRISSFDYSNVKKPVCKFVLQRYKLISVLKTTILAENSSVLCFVYHGFVQDHFFLDVFGGTQNTKRFCGFVSVYNFERHLCRLCFVHFVFTFVHMRALIHTDVIADQQMKMKNCMNLVGGSVKRLENIKFELNV